MSALDDGTPTASGYRPRPTKRPPQMTQVIVSQVMSDIASKRLVLGQQLPSQQEMAAQFGVSQPTIREAVSALAAMGLIDVRHGSGAFVVRNVDSFVTTMLTTLVQVEDVGVLDVLEIRGALAVYSVARAATYAEPDEIELMRDGVRACDEARTIPDMARAIVAFQLRCSQAAHNSLLFALESFVIRAAMKIQLVAEGARGLEFWLHQTAQFSENRHALVERIAARDVPGAVEAMRSYLTHQQQWFSSDPEMATFTMSDTAWSDLDDFTLEDLG
jgi:GntR family transcriptional regulator, transcriptional repressor for pyruvate dehydrogenase complex